MTKQVNEKYLRVLFETNSEYSEWFGYYNYDVISTDGTKMLCNRVNFDEIKYSNDLLFSTYVGCYAKTIKAVDNILYIVTFREGSMTARICSKPDELRIRADAAFRSDRFLLQHDLCQKRHVAYYTRKMLIQDRRLFKYYFFKLDEIYPSKLSALNDIRKGQNLLYQVVLYVYVCWILITRKIIL